MTRENTGGAIVPSHHISTIKESQTIALTAKANALRAAGVDVISMTAGEPDFPTPDHIKEAAAAAIRDNFTRYTAVQGIPELLQAVVEKFRRDNGLEFTPGQVVVTAGAKQALINALFAICDPADEVILLAPYWVSYPAMVQLVGANPVIVSTGLADGFRPDPERIEAAITPRTRAIIINTPNNPSAVVYSRDELTALAQIADRHDLVIISDEVYESVRFDGRHHVSLGTLPGAAHRTITIASASKSYSMTGWRIGYMAGPGALIKPAITVQSQMTSNANSIAQKAAVAALTGPQSFLTMMSVAFQERRDICLEALKSVEGVHTIVPEGAMFFFLSVNSLVGRRSPEGPIRTSADVAAYLLGSCHVAVVPGDAFGDDSCIRMSISCSEKDLREGLKRIAEAVRQLQ